MHKRATVQIAIALAVAVAALMGILTAAAQQAPSATRSFSAPAVDAGAEVTVTIAVANYGGFGAVTETLPAGFSYKSSSLDSSQVRTRGQELRFTLQAESSFTYTVTAASTAGPHSFTGRLTDSNRNSHPVGGASSVTVRAAQTPTPSASRSFSPATVSPGAEVTVTIAVANYGGFGRVTETLPVGFSYKSSSLDASQVNTSGGQTIRFTLQAEPSFTYTVTAADTPGTYTFSGQLTDSNRNSHPVGGASSVTVPSPVVVVPPVNRAPVFGEGASASRSVAENSAPGTAVGDPVTATDRDRDRLTYGLSGEDEALFEIDSSSGQISVAEGTVLDFETQAAYAVSVEVRDPSRARDRIGITISVENVDEAGAVTLSAAQAQVGTEATATLTDPDGSIADVSWSWERSADGAVWTAIAGADASAYTPVEADQGHHLRATVGYTDGHGANKTAAQAFGDPVPAAPAPEEPSEPPEAEAAAEPAAELRVAARLGEDGRVEFALQWRPEDGAWSERVLTRARFLPAAPPVGRWLVSTPIAVDLADGAAQARIVARRLADGRTEFGLQWRAIDGGLEGEWGERRLPRARFLPTQVELGRWLVSTPLDLAADGEG